MGSLVRVQAQGVIAIAAGWQAGRQAVTGSRWGHWAHRDGARLHGDSHTLPGPQGHDGDARERDGAGDDDGAVVGDDAVGGRRRAGAGAAASAFSISCSRKCGGAGGDGREVISSVVDAVCGG